MILRGSLQGEDLVVSQVIPSQIVDLLTVLAIFALAYIIYRLVIAKIIDKIVKMSNVESGVASFWKYIVLAVVMLIAGTLAAPFVRDFSGVIYFVIGLMLGVVVLMLILGSKDVLINALSGYALMVYKPFKRGDVVVLNGEHGYVRDITAVYTEVIREDGICYVPNSELMRKSFLVKPMDSLSRLSISLKVGSDADVDIVEQLIRDAIKQCKEIATPSEPEIYLTDINGQFLTFQIVIKAVNPRRALHVRSQLLKMIKQSFESAGIKLF
ncbi:MAG: mechanosensitive ion channel [Candidatus Nezhaarchaeota archaeon]|nr:mechanosensitive ion channel [Candidatus Nezhaarchaeota archaeon]